MWCGARLTCLVAYNCVSEHPIHCDTRVDSFSPIRRNRAEKYVSAQVSILCSETIKIFIL